MFLVEISKEISGRLIRVSHDVWKTKQSKIVLVTRPTLSPGVGGQRVRDPGFGSHRRGLHVRHDPTLERADPLLDQLLEWQEGPGSLHHVLDPIPILALGGRPTPRKVFEATHVRVAQEDPGHQQEGSRSSMFSIRNARGRGIQLSDEFIRIFVYVNNFFWWWGLIR